MKRVEVIGNIGRVEEKENSQIVSICVNYSKKNDQGEYDNLEWWVNAVFDKGVKLSIGDKLFVRGDFVIEAYNTNAGDPAAKMALFAKEYHVIMRKKQEA